MSRYCNQGFERAGLPAFPSLEPYCYHDLAINSPFSACRLLAQRLLLRREENAACNSAGRLISTAPSVESDCTFLLFLCSIIFLPLPLFFIFPLLFQGLRRQTVLPTDHRSSLCLMADCIVDNGHGGRNPSVYVVCAWVCVFVCVLAKNPESQLVRGFINLTCVW